MSRSLRWRLTFKPRHYRVPIISPYTDKLRRAALGDDVCRLFVVRLDGAR